MSNEMFRKVMLAVMSTGCDPYNTHTPAEAKWRKRERDRVRREQEREAKRATRIEFSDKLK
jgi:hypothetical protein